MINAVKAVILNNERKLLLLQRNPELRSTDNWDLPGGIVEEIENDKTALIREVKEEIDITVTVYDRMSGWYFYRVPSGTKVDVDNYFCRLYDNNEEITLSEEHINYQWVEKEELRDYRVKHDSFYEAIENLAI